MSLVRYPCPLCDWYTTAPAPDPTGQRTQVPTPTTATELARHLAAVHRARR